MDKRKLTPGRKYLHHQKVILQGTESIGIAWGREMP